MTLSDPNRRARGGRASGWLSTFGLVALLALALGYGATPSEAQTDPDGFNTRSMYKSTHLRVEFPGNIDRVAVGDSSIVSTETLSDRELLFLGKEVGRTSVIVWFQDGSIEEFTMLVRRDLTLLERLLAEIHPGITAEVAPDRDAVVLRGLVPDVTYSIAAENAARNYLEAGSASSRSAPLVRGGEDAAVESAEPTVRVEESDRKASGRSVINLIQLEELPETMEQKLSDAFFELGADEITIQRLKRGDVPDDSEDVFLLRGAVKDQVMLTRALTVAQRFVVGKTSGTTDFEVIADESGAIVGQGGVGGAGGGGGGGGGGFGGAGGGGGGIGGGGGGAGGAGGLALGNQIESNIGRAKVIEVGGGRILSYIEVEDLPQIRVDIRLYEVDRNKLFNYSPATVGVVSDFPQGTLNPPTGAILLEGDEAVRTGSDLVDPVTGEKADFDVQGVISAVAGSLGTQFQLAGQNFAIDNALDILETKGIARSLSRPSLTVLSGELALFSVGGEVPISQQIFTDVTDGTGSVLNEVIFRSFGVQLGVRPLVTDTSKVTLDVTPSISLPDAALTASIRDSTGSELDSTAFETRILRTSARLDDGQALIIGGLHSISSSENVAYTPWFHRIPLIGWLFRTRATQDQDLDLVIVVHPVIVRDPIPESRLWAYPESADLLDMARAGE